MKIIKTYKHKLKPTKIQSAKIDSWIGACRVVYNLALETKIYAWQSHKTTISRFELQKQLIELKEVDYIKNVPSQVLQTTIQRLDKSYQSFFKGGGFPKWAKKDKFKSLCFPQGVEYGKGFEIKLPKLGMVSFHKDRMPKNGIIKQAILTKEIDGYYLSVQIQEPQPISIPKSENQVLGIDMGVAHFLTDSNGVHVANPKVLSQYERELRIAQRSVARKSKGSKNRQKAKDKLAKIHLKIKRVRQDFLHKQSRSLVQNNKKIIIEDLKLKNMTKSAKGTLETPGKNVNAKSGLNRVLLDVSIGEFFRQLEYKGKWYGTEIVRIDPKHTSQICPECGNKDKGNRKTQAKFVCTSCNYTENADKVAAKNIKQRGSDRAIPRKRKALA